MKTNLKNLVIVTLAVVRPEPGMGFENGKESMVVKDGVMEESAGLGS
jgi:hypothetical protein